MMEPQKDSRKKLFAKIGISIGAIVIVGALTIGVMQYVTSRMPVEDAANTTPDDTPVDETPNTPAVLDPQDQPIDAAVALIDEGHTALAKYDFTTARKKFTEAKNLYVAAKSDGRAADAEGLIQSVGVEEKAYAAMKAANPNFSRDGTLEPTNGNQ